MAKEIRNGNLADAKKILEDFKPDVVVGFGGYVTGPVLKMAVRMGIKTAIHEQNAFPGVANKALAKEVDKVMLTSPDAEQHMKCKNPPIVTGLPVRREILKADRDFARASMGIQSDDILVLSMGGSLGALTINNTTYNQAAVGSYNDFNVAGLVGHAVGATVTNSTNEIDITIVSLGDPTIGYPSLVGGVVASGIELLTSYLLVDTFNNKFLNRK